MGFTLPMTLLPLRWALTPPFHPYLKHTKCIFGGLLSVALSLGFTKRLPRPGVTRHRVSMEPGLSSVASFQNLQQQSPDQLAMNIIPSKTSETQHKLEAKKQ